MKVDSVFPSAVEFGLVSARSVTKARAASLIAWVCLAEQPAHAETKQACGDAYYAVQVLRDEGKLAEALEAAQVCVSEGCAQFVRDDCTRWRDEIEANLAARPATVLIEAFDETGARIQEARATLEGAPWLASLDGVAQEVPPGTHTVEVTVDGEEPQRRTIVVRPGETAQRFAFTFDTSSDLARGFGPFPWVLGSVGAAAVIAGAVTGGLVIDAYLTTQDECDDETRTCSQEGRDAQERGRALGPATTGLLVGGTLFVGAGLLWGLLDPAPDPPSGARVVLSPIVSSSQVGLVLTISE